MNTTVLTSTLPDTTTSTLLTTSVYTATTFLYNVSTMAFNSTNATVKPVTSSKPPYWFAHVVPVFIVLLGAIGNTISIIAFSKKKYHGISTCYYMKALAMSDNFVMLLFFIRWLNKLPSSPIPHTSAFCIGYFFSVRMGFGLSAWILMFMTVDKYISTKFPLKAARLCTIKRARVSILIISIVHFIGHLPYFWRYADVSAITLSGQCPFAMSKTLQKTYLHLRIILIDRFLPWLLTLVFTVMLTYQLYKYMQKRKERNSDAESEINKKTRRVTAMSLIVAWMFFVLTFPTSINEAIRSFNISSTKLSAFIYDLFVYMLYLNSAVNFYLYMLVSISFRKDVIELFNKICGRGKSSKSYFAATSDVNSSKVTSVTETKM